ncbi:hypothetical protein [Luteolibacter luteus]|uniref:Uncharacterized protein n=1 Tax=Luteolibacter luteus TaxID=2728835 RepID=A0A858RFX5_9BACT|nr:hypothetical protein [Luteolibacter luteus]QJE96016.1 hypothetical protein HHL09_09545 [Luteolibacter luteus]
MDKRFEILLSMAMKLVTPNTEVMVTCDARKQYPRQDFRWYERIQKEFEAEGARLLGDGHMVSPSGQSSSDEQRTFVRCMVNGREDTAITLFRTHPRLWTRLCLRFLTKAPSTLRSVALQTFFADETSVLTMNLASMSMLESPPNEDRHYLSPDISMKEMIAAHERHVTAWQAQRTSCPKKRFRTMDEFIEIDGDATNTTKRVRKSYGGLTKGDIMRFVKCRESEAAVIQKDLIETLAGDKKEDEGAREFAV